MVLRSLPVLLLLLVLLLWLPLFAINGLRHGPNGRGMGGDLALFLAAARVQQGGGNPYDPTLTVSTERAWLRSQGVPLPPHRSFLRVGNPPVVFWALRPLAALPFQRAALVWIAAMATLLLLTFLLLRRYGSPPGRLWSVAVVALLPQTLLAVYYGNLDALVAASLAVTLLLQPRHPLLAGVALSLSWVKPQVGLPLAFLLLLYTPYLRSLLSGLVTGTGLGAIASLAVTGTTGLAAWITALRAWSRTASAQVDLASFSGLYAHHLSSGLRLTVEAVLLTSALLLTLALRRRTGPAVVPPVALFCVWFLVSPFAHLHDEVVLTVPLLYLLPPLLLPALTVLAVSVLLTAVSLPSVDLTSLGVLAVALLLWPWPSPSTLPIPRA